MSKEDTNFEIVEGVPRSRGEVDSLWLLWSHKRGAWYAPHCHGYADALLLAGVYSEEEAKAENAKYPHVEPRRLADVLHYYETFWVEQSRRMSSVGGALGIFKRLLPLAIVDDRAKLVFDDDELEALDFAVRNALSIPWEGADAPRPFLRTILEQITAAIER